ncbi:MAG TPA: O-antigen ligase family protein, partial [Patescibacteria group bacterium]|nr:O-antigen ligase family protein [Patescibacteria group bacterium]
ILFAMQTFLNRIISFCFYTLFLVVPLTFFSDTSELFEFNKMWLVFILSLIIFVSWTGKMIITRQIKIQRTPLEIPLALFLASQIISSIFSLDPHVSFWGYYSRFNGGLLSTITYLFLYAAFVSNISLKQVWKYLSASVVAGVLVGLWGLPSHFGYDPTCLLFRGTFDVSCWTNAFQPKVRIFSTLGQPDWLSAYLVLLTPIALALGINAWGKKKLPQSFFYFGATILFYVDNLYTRARSGFIGMMAALVVFVGWYLFITRRQLLTHGIKKILPLGSIIALCFVITFFLGTSIAQLDKFSFDGIKSMLTTHPVAVAPAAKTTATASAAQTEFGGTDSGRIRLYVWQGALSIWKAYPLFGSGVETFAYAYYMFRPAGHNMTSEWDYLYNKAHNEYLNYLATTGLFGLATYLSIIGLFFFTTTRLWKKHIPQLFSEKKSSYTLETHLVSLSLVASYVSILVTNFFGFSVVNVNLYFFLIPAFLFFIEGLLPNQNVFVFPKQSSESSEVSGFQWLGLTVVSIIGIYFLLVLTQYWTADRAYALGLNLDHAGQYQQAYQPLHDAVQQRTDEPTFQDELAINDAILAGALISQDSSTASKLAQEAVTTNTTLVTQHPNNVTFWKSRVRIMYILAQLNSRYMQDALIAIQKAHQLAPTDAKVDYNLGLLYGQTGQLDSAIATLKETIQLKSDYRDAYYALGIFYRNKAVGKGKTVTDPQAEQQAVALMHHILSLDPTDKQAQTALESWGEQ